MTDEQAPKQRLRIWFARGPELRYVSHLDMARTWERSFRRAGLPVAYSRGFNPRPRFQIASALPVGVTGREELTDVWLDAPLDPQELLDRLRPALPVGLDVMDAQEVDLRAPSLQSQMRAARYVVTVVSQEPVAAIQTRIDSLLEAPVIMRQRHHKGKMQPYDLRPLVQSVAVEPQGDKERILSMRLQASPQGAGRPDQVLDVLGLSTVPFSIERTNLYFEFDK
jgi:radical SAM-linked protein